MRPAQRAFLPAARSGGRAATPKQARQRADNDDEEWRSAGLRRQAVARRAGL
jgi:hypothetical protein